MIGENKTLKNASYIVYVSDSNESFLRYGISVGKKIGIAVLRNKIKRQIRKMLQEIVKNYGSKKKRIIIIVRKIFLTKTYAENELNLRKLISSL